MASESALSRFENLVGHEQLIVVDRSGGKVLLTNQQLAPPAGSPTVSQQAWQPSQVGTVKVHRVALIDATRNLSANVDS